MSQKPKQITDDDGFIKVSHKGRKGQRKKPGQEIEDKDRIEGSLYDHDSILQRLHDCRYFNNILFTLTSLMKDKYCVNLCLF